MTTPVASAHSLEEVVIASPAMARVYELVDRLASTSLSVLVVAETGCGKELIARRLHARSPRAQRAMVAVNCAAIPDTLAGRELFGHERGAFTDAREGRPGLIEAASGSTLFLDELGELSLATQARLLRVLESRRIMRLGATHELEVDIRLVAATNQDLDVDMRSGKFRRDLFYRLNTAVIDIPALRARPAEIRPLAQHFLNRARLAIGRGPMQITVGADARLHRHAWPGNVRELKNLMEFLGSTVDGDALEEADIDAQLGRATRSPPSLPSAPLRPSAPRAFVPLADEVQALEETRIAEALEQTNYNKTAAAQLLGMPLRTFFEKVKGLVGKGRLSVPTRNARC